MRVVSFVLCAASVSLKLAWSAKLPNTGHELTALTVPVIVINQGTPRGFKDSVVVAGSSDTVFALGSDNGKTLWHKKLTAEGTPKNVFALSSGENARQVNDAGRLYTSEERATTPIGNATLYAFDAETGKELFSSGKTIQSFTHFSGLAISEGRIYVTTWDNTVCAFGLGM